MSVVAIESLVCPQMAFHCLSASYLELVRPSSVKLEKKEQEIFRNR